MMFRQFNPMTMRISSPAALGKDRSPADRGMTGYPIRRSFRIRPAWLFPFLLGLACCTQAAEWIDRLLADYAQIQSVSCTVQRHTVSGEDEHRLLSRVWYRRPDQLHVESRVAGLDGVVRRIIADGKRLYMHLEGEADGFSREIEALEPALLIEIRRLPGTAMDHFLRLKGLASDPLPPREEMPVRRLYQTPSAWVELALDPSNRPVELSFYRDEALTDRFASYRYDAFREVIAGVWVPMRHRATFQESGMTVVETLRISAYAVNQPFDSKRFDPDAVFKDVRFPAD